MLIGGHVSTRGGIDKAPGYARAIGAEVIQTHPSPPQQWQPLRLDDGTVEAYRRNAEEMGLRGHWFHAIYLVNLATQDPSMLRKSVASLVHYMDLADRIGGDGVVFHPGSHKGAGFEPMLGQMASALREVLDRTSSRARLLVENSAGQGGCVGCSFDEVAQILDTSGADERLGCCLDTAHSFASGYDLRDSQSVDVALKQFDATVGLDRLVLVHANDSRAAFQSNVDRHANIGDGEIGIDGFTALARDARLAAVPWILEVPGDGQGPNLAQVNVLRSLAGRNPAAAEPAEAVAAASGLSVPD